MYTYSPGTIALHLVAEKYFNWLNNNLSIGIISFQYITLKMK